MIGWFLCVWSMMVGCIDGDVMVIIVVVFDDWMVFMCVVNDGWMY